MKAEPYLYFNGTCEEALDFYTKAIGAKIAFIMRYKETPPDELKKMPAFPKGWGEKIMHACLTIGESMIMVSDAHESMCGGNAVSFNGFALSVSAADIPETKRFFDALSKGGNVVMPVGPTFWGSPAFGMLVDKFGVSWMVSAPTPPPKK